jgi:PAS domain S-box-containing protein
VDLRQFKRILIQVFLLPVFALLLMAVCLYVEIESNGRTTSALVQTDARISQTTLVTRLVVDEETGLRGYQTTGDKQFLAPYNKAQSALQGQLSMLAAMPGASPSQVEHIRRVREAHDTWQTGFAQLVIALIGGGGQATDLELNLHGKQLMDDIRTNLDAIVREAQTQREEQINLRQYKRRELLGGIFIGALVFGVGIGLFTWNRLHAVSRAYGSSLEMVSRRADELFKSEQELRTTLASIGDGVIVCDADGGVMMMNPVAEELTGWRAEEAKGRPLEEVFHIVNEETRLLVESPVAKVKRLGGVVGLANHTVLIRKDGSELHIADSGAPIPDKSGKMRGIVMVFRDITMERRTQEALLANEKLAVAGRLAATIAHEIHNPLDSVSNLLYLMRNGASAEESKQFMALAEQELARVTQISRAMLGLYRESKTPVQVDLREMLQEILLLMDRSVARLGVRIHSEIPEAMVIQGFPAELRQVFSNLIMNAAEAAGRGGEVWLSVAPEAAGLGYGSVRTAAGAVIRVKDNGAGIPEEVRASLFQPFFTTKGEQGTGLGLWVSRGIVNKHGGSISIESRTDSAEARGTVVSVFLAEKPTIQLGGD